MIRLSGEVSYALLRRTADGHAHELHFFKDLKKALAFWGNGGRLSPVYPFTGSALPDLEDGAERTVLFFGPVYPGHLPEDIPGNLFLTQGIYNLLWLGDRPDILLEFCESAGCPREKWTLQGYGLTQTDPYLPSGQPTRFSLPQAPLPLRAATAEYAVNLNALFERSRDFPLRSNEFIERFAKKFTASIVRDRTLPLTARQTELVLANAALSRYSSQTFSGTSPILETECHFWSHSLFGIGTASLALISIRDFIAQAFSRAQIIDRFVALQQEAPTNQPLISTLISDPFWLREHLTSYPSQINFNNEFSSGTREGNPQEIPLLTCFSGRDGFRSTRVSLSAPLETLSSGNTPAWSLLTLTHEMSHPIVEALLGIVLPRFNDRADIERIVSWFGTGRPENLLERVREFVIHALLELTGHTEDLRINPRNLGYLVAEGGKELNELLAHSLDFLYFYGRDPARYIPGIWLTWGAVPNIEHRVQQYLVRTLCALHTTNTMRSASVTVDQAATHLSDLQSKYPKAPYVARAVQTLREDRDTLEKELKKRAQIAAFARGFLYSEKLAGTFEAVSGTGGGRTSNQPFRALAFPPSQVSNPLYFIETQAVDRRPDEARSAWLLTMLAFTAEEN